MANKQQINEWIKKYGEEHVYMIQVQLPGDKVAQGYFAKVASPGFDVKRHAIYSRAMSAYKNGSSFEVGEIVLNETFLGGDDRFKDLNSMVHISAAQQLSGEIDFFSVTTQPISKILTANTEK